MKNRILFLLSALLLYTSFGYAQTKSPAKAPVSAQRRSGLRATLSPHGATLTWAISITGASFNVYRAPCSAFTAGTGTPNVGTCTTAGTGAFANICTPSCPAENILTYTDSGGAGLTSYVYRVTAVCNGTGDACPSPYTGTGESAPSNQVAIMTLADAPPAPTLSITTVAENTNGNSETVVAKWTDTNLGVEQWFGFSSGNTFLAQGLTSSQTGTFAELWTAPLGTPITFIACDVTGYCASQKAM